MSDLHALAAKISATTNPNIRAFADAVADILQPPAPTWENVTAYARQTIPFTAGRVVTVGSPGALTAAFANTRPGDLVKASPFTYSGKCEGFPSPSAPAMFDLTAVTFTGYPPGSAELPAVFLQKVANLIVLLGTVTNPGGGEGVLVHGASKCVVRVANINHVGSDALGLIPSEAPIDGCDFYVADASAWGQVPSRDPHPEQGTGYHGAQIGDSTYSLTNTRVAIYGHDGPTGACTQYGSDGGVTTGNRLLVKAERMVKVSKSQIAGTGLNLWGTSQIDGTVEYLEATDCQGPAVATPTDAHYPLSGVTVRYGRATRCNQNPKWPAPAWMAGPTYQDVK